MNRYTVLAVLSTVGLIAYVAIVVLDLAKAGWQPLWDTLWLLGRVWAVYVLLKLTAKWANRAEAIREAKRQQTNTQWFEQNYGEKR